MGRIVDSTLHTTLTVVERPAANVSVPAGGSYTSPAISAVEYRRARVVWAVKGANTTGSLEISLDGSTWWQLQNLAAGLNPDVALVAAYVRVRLSNAGAAAETNDVWLALQR